MSKAITLNAINSEDKSSQVRSASRDHGANGCDLDTVNRYIENTSLPPIDVFRRSNYTADLAIPAGASVHDTAGAVRQRAMR
jgi:hypothetical protein